MGRNPDKRAYSREVDKIRKRTKRGIARLEKQIAESSNFLEKRAARQQLQELQSNLAQLSARGKNKTYTERSREALKTLQSANVRSLREIKQQPIDFAKELRKAKAGGISALGAKGREKTQLFYRVTQKLWEGKPLAERNNAIMEGLGVSSLEVAYAKIMSRSDVRDVLRQLDTSGGAVEDTDELSEAYREAERMQKQIDTPTIVLLVQQIEAVKAYGASE